MNSSKFHFIISIVIASLVTGIIPLINLYTDFSRVLHEDYNYHYANNRENLAYLKIAYLLNNQNKFDNLIFGSSRVRFGINTNTLQSELGGKWYKVEYPGGTPLQHFHNLRSLLLKGYQPEKIILTIDDFDIWTHFSLETLNDQYNRRMYPNGVGELIDFYKFYLFKKPGNDELKIITGETKLKKYNRIIEENYGWGIPPSENPNAHKQKLSILPPYHPKMANMKYNYTEPLRHIAAFKALCDKQQITLYIVYFPSTPKTLLARNHTSIESFKNDLLKISEFYDFSGIYSITSNLSNWNEMSHFRTTIGDEIIQNIKKSTAIPGKFGTLVSGKNIERHISLIKENIISKIPDLSATRTNLLISDSLKKTSVQ